MRVILDTNVFLSGIFFSGAPHEILKAWRTGRLTLVLSPEIWEEYERAGQELQREHPGIDIAPFLELVALRCRMVGSPNLPERVCTDRNDDMFLACALASQTPIVVSGDKALRRASGYQGVIVMSPREYLDKILKDPNSGMKEKPSVF